MKATSPALVAYLNGLRPIADAELLFADCYTITLGSGSLAGLAAGQVLTYTNFYLPVALNGAVYAANALLVDGLRYKASIGVNVDAQQISLSASKDMTIGGIPFLQAVQQGVLDGAEIQRDRAFFANLAGNPPLAPLGSILLFKGRVAKVDSVGRTSAKISVASDLTLLAIDFPRRLWGPNCQHVLYDSGCRASRAAFTYSGQVGAGSTSAEILWAGALPQFAQGALNFTSGANTGVEVTIKSAGSGALVPIVPLPNAPAAGDAFTAAFGCDHTTATCAGRFNNLANFVGFPFMPPPEVITGPLSAVSTTNGKG